MSFRRVADVSSLWPGEMKGILVDSIKVFRAYPEAPEHFKGEHFEFRAKNLRFQVQQIIQEVVLRLRYVFRPWNCVIAELIDFHLLKISADRESCTFNCLPLDMFGILARGFSEPNEWQV